MFITALDLPTTSPPVACLARRSSHPAQSRGSLATFRYDTCVPHHLHHSGFDPDDMELDVDHASHSSGGPPNPEIPLSTPFSSHPTHSFQPFRPISKGCLFQRLMQGQSFRRSPSMGNRTLPSRCSSLPE
ncbi:hypothetical protein OG21DRAFT_1504839 [Imleria badia]|nr:hypothetical protein OG21DRAFT_1504839 [Imleria badia]